VQALFLYTGSAESCLSFCILVRQHPTCVVELWSAMEQQMMGMNSKEPQNRKERRMVDNINRKSKRAATRGTSKPDKPAAPARSSLNFTEKAFFVCVALFIALRMGLIPSWILGRNG
jgi:hypothetical protein